MKKKEFESFVTSSVVNFMEGNYLDKISLQDEDGNKAKITRKSDNSLKVETTFSEMM